MTARIALVALLMLVVPASAFAATRCARIDTSTGTIAEYRVFSDAVKGSDGFAASGCPGDIARKNVQWLPAPEAVKPAYDSATQVLSGPTITIGQKAVTTSYSVRDKTADELAAEADAAKDARLSSVDEFVLRTLCDHESRIRVLEGKSAITFIQCRAAIKAALQ